MLRVCSARDLLLVVGAGQERHLEEGTVKVEEATRRCRGARVALVIVTKKETRDGSLS